MVRLRREIEGVRRNHAVPPPPYACDVEASALILPALDAWLTAHADGRTLLGGSVPQALAESLARAGQWVTVVDLDDATLRRWHASMAPEVAAQLTLLARPYGEVSFGPASFDRIGLLDALGTYRDPNWVISKATRELKPDGILALREPVRGPVPKEWLSAKAGRVRKRAAVASHVLPKAQQLLSTRVGPWMAGPAALEALDRGAHVHGLRFSLSAAELHRDVAAHLTLDRAWVGDPRRLQACCLFFGARPWLRPVLRATVGFLPEADARPAAGDDVSRCVGLIARRALAGGLRFG